MSKTLNFLSIVCYCIVRNIIDWITQSPLITILRVCNTDINVEPNTRPVCSIQSVRSMNL